MQPLPQVTLHPRDVRVIVDILHPYAVYVRKKHQPSAWRGLLLVCIENLRTRLLSLAKGEDNQLIFLAPRELEIIDQALELFLSMIPSLVRKSQERDDTLTACRNLKQSLLFVFGPQ